MHRLLAGCGIATLVVIGILAAIFAIFMTRGPAVEAESQKAAREAVVAIVTNWDQQELLRRSSDELKSVLPPDKVGRIFATYRRLGKLQSLGAPQGKAEVKFLAGSKNGVNTRYSFPATFSAGKATITIRMRKTEAAGWKMFGFTINSDAFLQ